MMLAFRAGQEQRRHRLHDLQREQDDQQPAVRAQVGADELDQHARTAATGPRARMPSSRTETISSDVSGSPTMNDECVPGEREAAQQVRGLRGRAAEAIGFTVEEVARARAAPTVAASSHRRAGLQRVRMPCSGRGTRMRRVRAGRRRPRRRGPRTGASRRSPRCALSTGAGSRAASTIASRTSFLSAKTRKIVPSAIAAACAISRVVIAPPWSRKMGSAAATIAARRSSIGRAAARTRGPAVAGMGPPYPE